MSIPFVKMQGLGNDFVVIDDLGKPSSLCHKIDAELARAICDRRFGVGADQILWLKSSHGELDARMDILNADGSTAEMCGNGIRAAALYLYRHGPRRKEVYRIETLGGVKDAIVRFGDAELREMPMIKVDMGVPVLGAGFGADGEALKVAGRELKFYEVNMGNPHAVIFVDRLEGVPVEEWGPLIENHPRFPLRTNVEFVEIIGESAIRVRVWERGAGITLACGTGACASAVASLATGRVKGVLEVQLPGGALNIEWRSGEPVMMEGPALEVFKGEFLEV